MKQDVIPSAKIITQKIQVGQPGYPTALRVEGTFLVDGTHWELKNPWWRKRYWLSTPKEFEKKCVVVISGKEMEKISEKWIKEWAEFENWREEMKGRAFARKAFDKQFILYEKIFRELFKKEIEESHSKSLTAARKKELGALLRYH